MQFCGGGIRSGKTEVGVAKGTNYAIGQHPTLSPRRSPPVYGRYVCTSWDEGVAVVLKKFQSMVPRENLLGHSWETAWSEGKGILTFCLDRRKTVEGSKIGFMTSTQSIDVHRGADLDFVIMDEHHEKKYFVENIGRLTDRGGWMLLTMTPEAGITWEDQEILERARAGDQDYEFWFLDSRRNPHLSQEGLRMLLRTLENEPELFEAKVKGRFVALSGLVYPMFKREVHVIDDERVPVIKLTHRQMILDLHLKKAAAMVWAGWTGTGDYYIYRIASWKPNAGGIEDLGALIRIKSMGEKINDWIIDESLGGDPQNQDRNVFGEKNVITQLNDLGLPFVGTNVASDKSLQAGILKMRRMLRVDPVTGRPRLFVARSCYQLIREFEIYQFRKSTPVDEEVYRERIRNIEDDYVTCVRYGVMAEPAWNLPPRIEEQYDPESGAPTGPGYMHRGPAPEAYPDDRPWDDEDLS